MNYAITYKDEGIENPKFIYATEQEVAKKWYENHAFNTSSLDVMIVDRKGNIFEAGNDGNYFLNLRG